MIRLIRADLRRLRRKPALYILTAFVLFRILFRPDADTAADQVASLRNSMNIVGMWVPSIPVFLGVYGDEIKSGALATVIGRGTSRRKFVVAKLLDVFILFLFVYALELFAAVLCCSASELGVTDRQYLFLAVSALYSLIRVMGYFAITSLVVFETWSAAGGMVVLIINILLLGIFLEGAQNRLHLPIYDLSLDGLLDASYAAFSAGGLGWQILPALVIYIGFVVWLTVRRFNKKEIDL